MTQVLAEATAAVMEAAEEVPAAAAAVAAMHHQKNLCPGETQMKHGANKILCNK